MQNLRANSVFVFPASGSVAITGSFTGSFTSSVIYDVRPFSNLTLQTIGTGSITLQQTNLDIQSQNNLPANAKVWNPLLTVTANTSSAVTSIAGAAYIRYMTTGSVVGYGIVKE